MDGKHDSTTNAPVQDRESVDARSVATAELLWAACHRDPDADVLARAVAAGADVGLAGRVALTQRAGPLFWRGISRSPEAAGAIDENLGASLTKEVAVRRAQAALLLPRAVAFAVDPMMRAGIEPLLTKGAALASRYPSPDLRPMDDIDIVIPRGSRKAAVRALEQAGWKAHHRKYVPYDTMLTHPAIPHLPLELHHGLHSWKERANSIKVEDLWKRRVPIEAFGVVATGLPPELELIFVASHAGKPNHIFERILWFADVATIVTSAGPSLDWDAVLRFAQSYECRTVLAVALHHARRLGAAVPDEAIRFPSGRYRPRALEPLLDVRWPLDPYEPLVRRRLRFVLLDSPMSRVSLAADALVRGPGPAASFLRTLLHRLWLWRRAPADTTR